MYIQSTLDQKLGSFLIKPENQPGGIMQPSVVWMLLFSSLYRFLSPVNACNPGYVNSLVSRFMGTRTPAQGAEIIIDLATTDSDASGKFFDYNGKELTW